MQMVKAMVAKLVHNWLKLFKKGGANGKTMVARRYKWSKPWSLRLIGDAHGRSHGRYGIKLMHNRLKLLKGGDANGKTMVARRLLMQN